MRTTRVLCFTALLHQLSQIVSREDISVEIDANGDVDGTSSRNLIRRHQPEEKSDESALEDREKKRSFPYSSRFGPPSVDWKTTSLKSLVQHVLNTAPEGDIDACIREFDAFVADGLSLGDQKGVVIAQMVTDNIPHGAPVAILEAGAHAGDGTMRIARALIARRARLKGSTKPDVIISTESNGVWAAAAQALLDHALGDRSDVEHYVLQVRSDALVSAAENMRRQLRIPGFNLLLMDHDHRRFLQDLKSFVKKKLLLKNGVVHADNCGKDKDKLHDYLEYIHGRHFATKMKKISKPYIDEVAISKLITT